MRATLCDVAVIGAGFTGASLTIQLLQRLPAGSRIVVVGNPDETGTGLAYGNSNPDLLLNVRASRMSLHAEDEADFVRWLAEKSRGGRPLSQWNVGQTYVSRAAYGHYVRDTLFRAVEQARHRVTVEFVPGPAVALRPVGDEFRVTLGDGDLVIASWAALCLGNTPSEFPLRLESIAPAALPRMIADPWHDARMRSIPADARVLFVGTGLTMIDQALALTREGHAGPLRALSRHGLLPASQPKVAAEPVAIELPSGNPRLSALFRTIVRAAKQARDAGRDWRPLMDGLRPMTQEMWQRLSPAGKRRFLRHVESYWTVHRHRMAPAAAERIAALQASGQLQLAAARIVAIRTGGNGIEVVLRRRGSRETEVLLVDWIINCTGPGRYAALAQQPLVAELVDQGLARPDGMRLSLDVSRTSALVSRSRRPAEKLFALGPLTKGRFFEITAAREIRAQTMEVAERLAAMKLAQMFPRGRPRDRAVETGRPLAI